MISQTGYLGIVLLMAIESACIPLPSEVIMPFSGYLVFAGRFRLLWVDWRGLWDAIWDRPWPTTSGPWAGGPW